MANINDNDGYFYCSKCGGDFVFKSINTIRLPTELNIDQLIIENITMKIRIEFLEKQLSEKPTKRININYGSGKIIPGQEG